MNNLEKNNFKDYSTIDGHLHLLFPNEIDTTVQAIKNILKYYLYDRVCFCALVQEGEGKIDPINNLKCLYTKSIINSDLHPNSAYVFGNIWHHYNKKDTPEGYLQQVQQLIEMGADGIKLLDGKPELRKRLGKPLNDPIFDLMYGYLEENHIQIVMHAGDPANNWNIDMISEDARARGWFYDESYPALQQIRQEVFGILKKFPKLKLCLAHFNFWGKELEAAKYFLDTWPNVSLDLTPGGEMFVGFSAQHKQWRAFFEKYADRIQYGTDTYNRYYENLDDYEGAPTCGHRNNLCRRMLESEAAFEDIHFGPLLPLNLKPDALKKIYRDNFIRSVGNARNLDFTKIADYAQGVKRAILSGEMVIEPAERAELDMLNLDKIIEYFNK